MKYERLDGISLTYTEDTAVMFTLT